MTGVMHFQATVGLIMKQFVILYLVVTYLQESLALVLTFLPPMPSLLNYHISLPNGERILELFPFI